MLEDVKAALKEDVVLGVLCFAFLFVGVFGAANWNNHATPSVPQKTVLDSDETYNHRVADYQRRVENVGKDAVVPWVWAMPMCLVGLAGAGFFGLMLASRHVE